MDGPKRWTMVAVVLGSSVVFLDSTVVNVALEQIGDELPRTMFARLEGQTLVYSGYLLSLSSLLILAGALADAYGRRRLFGIGAAGFAVTSLLCGLAPNMELLIVFRVLQGAAGALLVPGSLAIITAGLEGEERGRAYGIWAAGTASASILGPVLGGLLVQVFSWRAAFLMNIPILLVVVYATWKHVEETRDEQAGRNFDWQGALLIALGVGGLAFGAIRGQQQRWQDAGAFTALAIGAAATIAFPVLMAVSRNPLVPPNLFRSRNFTVTNISTLLIYGGLYSAFLFVPLYVQGTLGYDAAAAGAGLIPAFLFMALFSSYFGRLSARHGPKLFMSAGPVVIALGLLWLARVPSQSSAWVVRKPSDLIPPASYLTDLLPGWCIFGAGLMVMVAPLTSAVMTSVPAGKAGVASAINNAISRVGPQLAAALIFVAVTSHFYDRLEAISGGSEALPASAASALSPLNKPPDELPSQLAPFVRQASTEAFRLAMTISAALVLAGGAVNALGIRNQDALDVRNEAQAAHVVSPPPPPGA